MSRKRKFFINKDELQKIISDLESRGKFPNRNRLYMAICRTEWGCQQKLQPANIGNFVKQFDLVVNTVALKRERKPKQDKSPSVKPPKKELTKDVQESSKRVQLKRIDWENDRQLSKKYSEKFKANGKLVFYPTGNPLCTHLTTENVDVWVRDLLNEAKNHGLLYFPTAVIYTAQKIWPSYTEEFKIIRERIIQFFVDFELGEFVT